MNLILDRWDYLQNAIFSTQFFIEVGLIYVLIYYFIKFCEGTRGAGEPEAQLYRRRCDLDSREGLPYEAGRDPRGDRPILERQRGASNSAASLPERQGRKRSSNRESDVRNFRFVVANLDARREASTGESQ